jgi:hypothetical protein
MKSLSIRSLEINAGGRWIGFNHDVCGRLDLRKAPDVEASVVMTGKIPVFRSAPTVVFTDVDRRTGAYKAALRAHHLRTVTTFRLRLKGGDDILFIGFCCVIENSITLSLEWKPIHLNSHKRRNKRQGESS